VPSDLIRRELRAACIAQELVPTLCGASRRNIGVQPLIDAIVDFLPAPDEVPPAKAFHLKKEEEVDVPCDPSGNPLGLVFKVQYDREAGPLCFVRMYSGSIKNASTVYNQNKKKRERITRLLRMHANKSEPLDEVSAGRHSGHRGHEARPDGRHDRQRGLAGRRSRRCTSPSRSSRSP
jgi:elongation factor G